VVDEKISEYGAALEPEGIRLLRQTKNRAMLGLKGLGTWDEITSCTQSSTCLDPKPAPLGLGSLLDPNHAPCGQDRFLIPNQHLSGLDRFLILTVHLAGRIACGLGALPDIESKTVQHSEV
jgi:hypothetical protein